VRKYLEVEKVRWKVEQGEKLGCVLLHSYTISNIVINLTGGGGGGIMKNFDVDMGATLVWNLYIQMGGAT
jgi:hypothetical protein